MSTESRPTGSNEVTVVMTERAGLCAHLCRRITQFLVERWLGGVHAGLVVKSLYLQHAVGAYLKNSDKKILDAGCGPDGQVAALLATRFPSCSVEGMDLYCSGSVVKDNLVLREADLSTLTKVSAYDLVYSIDVLEHIEDFDGVLDRLTKAVRSGGLLFIHVPSLDQQHWFGSGKAERFNHFREHRAGDDHVHEGFSLAQLAHGLERRSVEVIEARPTFGRWVALLKELFSRGEARGVRGIGLLLLPAVILAVACEIMFPPKRGNGSMILGVKRQGATA